MNDYSSGKQNDRGRNLLSPLHADVNVCYIDIRAEVKISLGLPSLSLTWAKAFANFFLQVPNRPVSGQGK